MLCHFTRCEPHCQRVGNQAAFCRLPGGCFPNNERCPPPRINRRHREAIRQSLLQHPLRLVFVRCGAGAWRRCRRQADLNHCNRVDYLPSVRGLHRPGLLRTDRVQKIVARDREQLRTVFVI